jgi:hypothetical protein
MDLAIIPVVRNIPDPITMPIIIIVESNKPSCLRSFGEGLGVKLGFFIISEKNH